MSTSDKATEAATRTMSMLKNQIETQMGRQTTLLQRQAKRARKRIAESGQLNKVSDRRLIAENLHCIINDACNPADSSIRRVSKQSIVAKAGMAAGNGKSSRLYDYTLDPTLPPADRDKRANKRLVRKPHGYLKLAEATARLAAIDIDRVVVDLVRGTSLEDGMDSLPEETDPEHLTMLANAIRGEARRIVEQHGLAWYFRTIEEHGLVLGRDGWNADDDADMWTFLTVPSVNLFTEAVIHLEGQWHRYSADDDNHKQSEPRHVSVCRRVGLALAPFGPDQTVRPFFIRRPVLLVQHLPWRSHSAAPPSDYFDEVLVEGLPDQRGARHAPNGRLVVGAPMKFGKTHASVGRGSIIRATITNSSK